MSTVAGITVKSPAGAPWEFLVLFLVVIIGPPLLQRARLPGIIGLLIGGYLIGPYGLDVIGAGNTTVPELGQLGLLYLMFVAGVELDLALLRVHRRAVITFSLLTFTFPLTLGLIVAFSMHWTAPAALLLGSLFASHTLLVYPTVRAAGLSGHPAVATAVGATVITDTLSLVTLAAVSGSQLVGGGPATIAVQIVVGLVVVVVFTLIILPRVVRLAFRELGTDRVVRYLLAVASFLAAATVAASFGIEGIVGAFFAGLGLNRLVPNEGPLMDRIDFFGSAVFVPVFLVSVGMLLQPSVMIQPTTLKYAGLFIAASIGGKTIASAVAGKVLGFSRPQAGLMLGLTIPQAAATLAATVIGFNIGLFDQSVVNAVLVLILVSILVATLIVDRSKSLVPVPARDAHDIGRRILVALEDPAQAAIGFAICARIAAPETGVVRGLLYCSPSQARTTEPELAQLRTAGYEVGLDTDPMLLVHSSLAEGVTNVIAAQEPTFVLVGQRSASASPAFGSSAEAIAAATSSPVAILVGDAAKIREVELIEPDGSRDRPTNGASSLAAELAARIGGKGLSTRRAGDHPLTGNLRPGQLLIAPVTSYQLMAASDPPEGAALVFVLEPASWPGNASTLALADREPSHEPG